MKIICDCGYTVFDSIEYLDAAKTPMSRDPSAVALFIRTYPGDAALIVDCSSCGRRVMEVHGPGALAAERKEKP